MSEPRQVNEHRHFEEAQLLELALSHRNVAVADCMACAARVKELQAGFARVREVLASDAAHTSRAADASLAERVLALTTRESLDWRGDVKLVLAYARGRLRGSMWLRAAAAILVIHFAALPVLAWIVLRAPQTPKHFNLSIEPLPRSSIFADDPEERPAALRAELPDAEPALVELDAARSDGSSAVELAIAADAARLRSFALPAADATGPDERFARLLWARARLVQTDDGRGELTDETRRLLAGDAPRDLSPSKALELRALALEIRLDRFVLHGKGGDEARAETRSLAHAVEGADAELARLALARAVRLGLGADEPRSAAPPPVDVVALDPRWLDALARSGGLESDPFAQLWKSLRR